MRHKIAILAVIGLCGSAVWADSLTINSIPYRNIRVVDVAKLRISYDMTGTISDKPLSEVTVFVIDSSRDFNKAEDAAKAGKYAEAVAAYNEAEKLAGTKVWLKRLINYRRLRAASAGKMPGQAVADWLAIMDEAGSTRSVVALSPTTLAAKGSPENAKAIALLEKRIDNADTVSRPRIRELLMKLYDTEGHADKAAMLRGEAGEPAAAAPGRTVAANGSTQPQAAMTVGPVSRQLQDAADQFKLGNYDVTAKEIESRLDRYSANELAGALLLRGKALAMSYEKGGRKDVAKLKQAGLCFMRIVGCMDPTTPEAPEALYRAAMVAKDLGNATASANALRMLVSRHGDSEWGQKAKAGLGNGAAPAPGGISDGEASE